MTTVWAIHFTFEFLLRRSSKGGYLAHRVTVIDQRVDDILSAQQSTVAAKILPRLDVGICLHAFSKRCF
jgi:hypothetical protein